MANTIKRTSTKLRVRTLVDFSTTKQNTILEINKDKDTGHWLGGGGLWCIALLRNSELIQVLEQN